MTVAITFPRGVSFALIVTPANRAERCLTLNVLRGEDGPEEHRNLPMDDVFKVMVILLVVWSIFR